MDTVAVSSNSVANNDDVERCKIVDHLSWKVSAFPPTTNECQTVLASGRPSRRAANASEMGRVTTLSISSSSKCWAVRQPLGSIKVESLRGVAGKVKTTSAATCFASIPFPPPAPHGAGGGDSPASTFRRELQQFRPTGWQYCRTAEGFPVGFSAGYGNASPCSTTSRETVFPSEAPPHQMKLDSSTINGFGGK